VRTPSTADQAPTWGLAQGAERGARDWHEAGGAGKGSAGEVVPVRMVPTKAIPTREVQPTGGADEGGAGERGAGVGGGLEVRAPMTRTANAATACQRGGRERSAWRRLSARARR
jgi:hypothetical protein